MSRTLLTRAAFVLLAFLLVPALAPAFPDETDPAPKAPKADIRGTVTNVAAVAGRTVIGVLVVEGKKEADTSHDKASIRVTPETRIEKLVAGKPALAKFGEIKKGTRLQAVFKGPVAESYPVQATADRLLILGDR